MARLSGEKGKATKARLMAFAASEFARKGYHDVKISDIVAAAGLSQPAFYLYFASKEAIFIQLIESFRERVKAIIEQSLLEDGLEKNNVSDNIQTKLIGFFDFLAAEPDLTRIGLFIDPNKAETRASMVHMIRENLAKEQRTGYFRSDVNMDFAAECLVSMLERLTETRLLPGLCGAESLAAQVVDLLLHGMAAE